MGAADLGVDVGFGRAGWAARDAASAPPLAPGLRCAAPAAVAPRPPCRASLGRHRPVPGGARFRLRRWVLGSVWGTAAARSVRMAAGRCSRATA
eukprot:524648-Alexandrium_andersonii.AAC.1